MVRKALGLAAVAAAEVKAKARYVQEANAVQRGLPGTLSQRARPLLSLCGSPSGNQAPISPAPSLKSGRRHLMRLHSESQLS